ncbi:lipocalin-like domain-containing protein [Granulicella sp. WH15]|uniref:lipocalin-like domain-containing protein n=1 Tax=Granulicella sp. WH15 TaxID=2602070 RepID=UPI0013672FF0|nr:lipocalin-like domain-containing protein [Granulicella sp. WH15]QHN02561.1 lipocalin-like domain-containing protein [Granulicella sp. WH15]
MSAATKRLGHHLLFLATLLLLIIPVSAQQKATQSQLVGYWKLLSVDNVKPDGTRAPRHGAHPAGLLIFDNQGRYSLIVLTEGTPEEYKAAVEGNNADYGHYTVNEAEQSVTFFMDHASHPQLEGSSHTRYFTLKGDRLTYTTTKLSPEGKSKDTFGEVVLEKMK